MKKTIGWILLIVGLLALLGGLTNTVETDPLVKVFVYGLKFLMIFGGGYMAFSEKTTEEKKQKEYLFVAKESQLEKAELTSNKSITINESFPEYTKYFIKDVGVKNSISESIYKKNGFLEFNHIEGTYIFSLSKEYADIRLTCNFIDNNSNSVSESLVVGSFEESQKLNFIQWTKTIDSLMSKIEKSHIELMMNNIAKFVNESNLFTKIKQAKQDANEKFQEFSKLRFETKTTIENRIAFHSEEIKKIENGDYSGDSSFDLETQKEVDKLIKKKLDEMELRSKQLEKEIYQIESFLTSDEVTDFLKKGIIELKFPTSESIDSWEN